MVDNGTSRAIGLLDHMGYGNLGDAAIQDSVIANIKKRLPNAVLVGFSQLPEDTIMRHGIPSHPIRWSCPTPEKMGRQAFDRMSFKLRLKSALKSQPLVYTWAKPLTDFVREALFWVQSYRALRNLDMLIISGGGQLCELWGGPWCHPYTIFKFALLTKIARKKLYFLNVGAGPLEHPLSKLFTRCAVRCADYVSFRDHGSQELVRSLGVRMNMYVYPDPAYALELQSYSHAVSASNSMPIVGVNPFGFCDPRVWPRKDNSLYQQYLEKITCFSEWLLERGYTLRVFTTEMSVDQLAIEDLKARLYSRLSSPELLSQVFGKASTTVNEILREMSQFDFIVTSKFHGIIFSHLLGKPVISLSYHTKMDVAMRALGQAQYCADVERFDVEWLIKAFRSLINDSRNIKSRSAAAVKEYAATLSQQFDHLFLANN